MLPMVTLFSSGFQLCYGGTASTGTLNLDSGTLQLGGPISKNGGTGTATVNLNGGTVQAGVNNITLIDTTPSSVNVFKVRIEPLIPWPMQPRFPATC